VDIRGRSRTLFVNYRTSHQIRMQADQLLESQITDLDGTIEQRTGTISVFNGTAPHIATFANTVLEQQAICKCLQEFMAKGIKPQEIGVFVRSNLELPRAKAAINQAALPFKILDESLELATEEVSLCTMHHAKGLEFKAVIVMACDDEIIPSQERIANVSDTADLEEIHNTERHLLYVACTRARDELFVSGVEPVSEFLADLKARIH
jgi:superfamily I DNA/RNA helicase